MFPAEKLDQLKNYIEEIRERSFGLTTSQGRRLVFDFAEQNQIERRLGWTGYGDSGRNTKSVSELRRQHQSIVL